MIYDVNSLSEQEARRELDKYVRLFDVTFEALLLMSNPGFTRDRQEYAADRVALVERYPNDDRYVCGGSPKARELELAG